MTAQASRVSFLLACGLLLSAVPALPGRPSEDLFKQTDTDGDGRITRLEHAAGAQVVFDQLDTNSDSILTTVEMDAKAGSKMSAWDRNEGAAAADKIAEFDTDLDGQVTRTEHESGTALIFGRMDTNNDGYLSAEECEAGHKVLKKVGA